MMSVDDLLTLVLIQQQMIEILFSFCMDHGISANEARKFMNKSFQYNELVKGRYLTDVI